MHVNNVSCAFNQIRLTYLMFLSKEANIVLLCLWIGRKIKTFIGWLNILVDPQFKFELVLISSCFVTTSTRILLKCTCLNHTIEASVGKYSYTTNSSFLCLIRESRMGESHTVNVNIRCLQV